VSKPSVTISAYDPQWPRRGARLAAQFHTALGPDACASGVRPFHWWPPKTFWTFKSASETCRLRQRALMRRFAGWVSSECRYNQDDVPAGRSDDPALWAKRFWRRRSHADGDVNLHVRLVGRTSLTVRPHDGRSARSPSQRL